MASNEQQRRARFLAAYDAQLRGDAEVPDALTVDVLGPLRLATFAGGNGFVTYRDLGGLQADAIRRLVPEVVDFFRNRPEVDHVEWKTRAHDEAPGLVEALTENDFVPDDPESIMIGEAAALAVEVPLPDGVTLRRVTDEPSARAMTAMQGEIFGDPVSDARADALVQRLSLDDGMELWVAEADGVIVTAGRIDPVPDSDFAGIWGGATRPEWRGRGIYRALTAARARSALARGKTLINSDSTEFSRPILERSGFLAVSTTTPYTWTRPA
ncbi:MAG: GNAT family N-acetyltransferase [Actinomycetota bacterium]|nr:GNAT family N-acetyltransferase [Actinomycetota bacterium]